jgi:preprotein translocase subunit SecY
VGKGLPLYMIDVSAYIHKSLDASELLLQSISGDIYRCSVFALGISPYMIASMLVQIINAFRKAEIRKKISPKKNNKMVLMIMVIMLWTISKLIGTLNQIEQELWVKN